jgi:phosphoribosyl 1,2-cyclic phosphate phosphodiesterase
MNPSTTITFLGTGTSTGVPVIGCDCPVCRSADPRNKRTRCSLHLRSPGASILIDSGPDLREQALREDLTALDAVLYTHAHLDHIAGFDELRAFCWHRDAPLPLHAGPETMDSLKGMFPWAFQNQLRSYVRPDPREIHGPFRIADVEILPLPVEHGGIETMGFRFRLPGGESFAYLSDVKRIPPPSRDQMGDLDLLVIDALRRRDHPTHMTLEESLATAAELSPRRTILTHLAHELDFGPVSASLPETVSLASDGLKFRFPAATG